MQAELQNPLYYFSGCSNLKGERIREKGEFGYSDCRVLTDALIHSFLACL